MAEEWRPVLGGAYEVSSAGRCRRATTGRRTWPGRVLTPLRLKNGYLGIRPVIDGQNVQHYLHRLVAEAFIGTCPPRYEVNHIDGDKANPAAANLEYVTHAENGQHASRSGLLPTGERHPNAKLTTGEVEAIRSARRDGESGVSVARRFGVSGATVSEIHTGTKRRGG